MVLTDKQKAVIENDFNEKGWNAYKIWKEHPTFECFRMAVYYSSQVAIAILLQRLMS